MLCLAPIDKTSLNGYLAHQLRLTREAQGDQDGRHAVPLELHKRFDIVNRKFHVFDEASDTRITVGEVPFSAVEVKHARSFYAAGILCLY